MIEVLADPRTATSIRRLREELSKDPSATSRDAKAWLQTGVELYAGSLAMREIGCDPGRPQVLRDLDPGALHWFGMEVPRRGTSGESPDNIYRFLSLDGEYSYVLTGRAPPDGPIHFSLDARAASARKPPGHPAPPGRSDSGIQLGLLTEADIEVDDRGEFSITIDSAPAGNRRNHLSIAPGPVTVLLRNVFSDWRQRPTSFSIRRTDDRPIPPALGPDQIVQNLTDDLREWARYWFDLPQGFLGRPPENTFPLPVPRDGGWGRLTGCRFRLADDEALVVTTSRGGARYTGAQVLGPWMLAPEPSRRFVSRNISQSEADAEGLVTYVLSPRDPGVPNWLDSLGLGEGVLMLRWSAFPPGSDPVALVRQVDVVRLADIAGRLPPGLRRLSPQEREAELSRRVAEYAVRTSA